MSESAAGNDKPIAKRRPADSADMVVILFDQVHLRVHPCATDMLPMQADRQNRNVAVVCDFMIP